MSKNSLHIILVIICAAVFFSCKKSNDKWPDLREKYSYTDTRAFGTYTAYRIFENIYPEKFINLNTKPFSKFYNSTHFDSASFYFSVSNKFYVTEEDAQSIIDFVYDGNTAFISASVIDTVLLSKIFSRQENTEWLAFLNGKRFMKTTVHLLPDEYSERDSFSYYYRPFVNYFQKYMETGAGLPGTMTKENPISWFSSGERGGCTCIASQGL